MVRRNLLYNPRPIGIKGWQGSVSDATLTTFAESGGVLSFEAIATSPGAQMGVLWNDATQLHVRENERYAFTLEGIDVITLPDGAFRLVVLWYDSLSAPVSTTFGSALSVGTYAAGDPLLRIVEIAPEDAAYASVSLLWNGDDTSTPLEFTATGFLFEPLGPVAAPIPGAIVNLVTAPTFEHCQPQTPPGGPGTGGDGWPDGTGWVQHEGGADGAVVWETQDSWTATGRVAGKSRRASLTADSVTLPNGLKGFIGSYVLPVGQPGWVVAPGETYTWTAALNILAAGPNGDPGAFLEMFWYYYDGDPLNTIQIRQDNSDGIYTPSAVALGVQTLTMTKTCPVGANLLQLTSVMGSGTTGAIMDFYTDCAILTQTAVLANWFDGDSDDSGWDGMPGYSTSRNPGIDARVPGVWFDGDALGAQWENGVRVSMSTMRDRCLQRIVGASPQTQELDLIRLSR